MSARRTLVELGLVVSVILGGAWLIVFIAGRTAGVLADYVPVEVDETIGEPAWRASIASKRCTNPEAERYVRALAEPLLEALKPAPYEFRIAVVDDPEVNAFALPGGYIVVNIGLVEAAESGEEIAGVLAHELEHVLLRHGTRRILRELGGRTILYAVFGGTDVSAPASLVADLANTAYDRDQESEADARGIDLMRRAGIDPSGMARFFRRLQKSGASPPAFLSTHPDPGDRADLAERARRDAGTVRALPPPKGIECR